MPKGSEGIASASNERQVLAVAEEIEKDLYLKAGKRQPRSREGLTEGQWVLLDYGDVVISVATYIIDVIMIIATVDAVLGISSKKPSSWRKVMRGALLLFVFSIIGAVLGSASATGLVTLSPLFVTVVCIPIAALMMLKSVRRYYVPPMLEMPSVGRWLGFVLFTQLFPAREYEIDYE